ncbi:outer membrane protein assembly factor BamB family protein [Streptomyces mexicanus]|uniref:PQQ-binding-like beta-propeller repeat protein n=1 Tax=Streptomyces mexicanus TaxID=178566 RepID=A0A7X1I2P9_9ACTN|nr:PQQ-binding-like beta-propeller repeat protein [Streptomyces mexicanus]MBC2867694.1 PQQ-binding-like beta-propeller repeat protein [Streptomyces mexicanus]
MYTQSALSADGRRKKRRRNQLLGLAGIVVVAVLAVVGVVLLRDDSAPAGNDKPQSVAQGRLDVRETVEKKPASTTGVMDFRFSTDGLAPGEHEDLPGMWATDKILAKGIKNTLAGLRIGTDASPGDEAWKLRLSGLICGYTRHVTVDGRTAVLSRSRANDETAPCDHLTFVDLDSGQMLWEHQFAGSRTGGGQDTPSVTLAHATVAVSWGGGAEAYDMDSGKLLWRSKAPEQCRDTGVAGGRALLDRLSCADPGTSSTSWESVTYKVRKLDPRTGRVAWTYAVAPGVRDVRVPSTDPAVLATAAGETGYTELLSLDAHGTVRATIRLQSGTYVGECSDEVDLVVLDDCPTIAVGAGQAFVRSKEAGGLHTSNWIIGFDLATGNTVKKYESGPNALLYPIRMSGDQLLALRLGQDHISPSALVSLDPRTGAETPYLYFSVASEAEALTVLGGSDVVVQNGRLFFGSRSVDGPSGKQKQWTWMVLGIGSLAAKH